MTNCIECKEDKEFIYNDGEHGNICIECHLEMFSECYKCGKFFPDNQVEFEYIEDEKHLVCTKCDRLVDAIKDLEGLKDIRG